jgi:hypothetical protein
LVRRRKAERALFLAPLASKPVDVSETPKTEHQTANVSKKPPVSDTTPPAMSKPNPLAAIVATLLAFLKGRKA